MPSVESPCWRWPWRRCSKRDSPQRAMGSTTANAWLAIRSVGMVVLVPGAVAGYVPYLILRPIRWPAPEALTLSHGAAAVLFLVGVSVLLTCVWHFARFGRGTLAPFDEPRRLVVQGLYRYVRNPMYLGVLAVLLAEAWFFRSTALLTYATGMLIVWNGVVVLVEEPRLRRKHGADYEAYCQEVGRWLPGPPYRGREAGR